MPYLCSFCGEEHATGELCPQNQQPYSDVKTQSHYTQFKIQPAVFIAANNLGYFEGNVIKYVCRYQKKNGVEDLKKAAHYLEMLIEKVTTGEVKL